MQTMHKLHDFMLVVSEGTILKKELFYEIGLKKIMLNSEVSFQYSCRPLACNFIKKETPVQEFSCEF